jgi:probable HAF family extracellular repeat protein
LTVIAVTNAISTQPSGINDAGEIVGSYTDTAGSHGFVYSHGSYFTIDAPSPAAPGITVLTGINNREQIAG